MSARVACAEGWTLVNPGLGVWARTNFECGHADGACQPPTDSQADGFKTLGESPLPLTDGEFAQAREEREIAAEVKREEFETIHERAHAGKSDPDTCDRGQGCPANLTLTITVPRAAWVALIACAEIGLEGADDCGALSGDMLDGAEELIRQLQQAVK